MTTTTSEDAAQRIYEQVRDITTAVAALSPSQRAWAAKLLGDLALMLEDASDVAAASWREMSQFAPHLRSLALALPGSEQVRPSAMVLAAVACLIGDVNDWTEDPPTNRAA